MSDPRYRPDLFEGREKGSEYNSPKIEELPEAEDVIRCEERTLELSENQ